MTAVNTLKVILAAFLRVTLELEATALRAADIFLVCSEILDTNRPFDLSIHSMCLSIHFLSQILQCVHVLALFLMALDLCIFYFFEVSSFDLLHTPCLETLQAILRVALGA